MVNAALFRESSLRDFLQARKREASTRAQKIAQSSLSRLGAQHFADKLAAELQIEPLKVDFDAVAATTEEVDVDVSRHPDFMHIGDGEALHPGTRISLRFPFSGLAELFTLHEGSYLSVRPRGEVVQNTPTTGTLTIAVDVPRGTDAASTLRRVREEQQNLLRQCIAGQSAQVETFNNSLPGLLLTSLAARLSDMSATESALQSIGIPLAPKAGSPTLPIRLRQQIDLDEAREISVSAARRAADLTTPRTITDVDHENILSLIRHQCRTFEGAPDAFAKLDEEHLRDVIRSSLNAVYRVASAEAFRSHGKTDLCIEAESRAAFVAECKVWAGGKGLSDAISQLLSYLTWRDCKAAIVVFNKEIRGFVELLNKKVLPCLQAHPSYSRTISSSPGSGEWRVAFAQASGTEVVCQIMVFNLHVV